MEFQKPLKCVLSLGRFGFDKNLVRTKVTFGGSSDNVGSDLDKKDKFSSRMKINQSAANYIDILKNGNRKPVIGSQINLTQNDCESTLSHMPVYHKVCINIYTYYSIFVAPNRWLDIQFQVL